MKTYNLDLKVFKENTLTGKFYVEESSNIMQYTVHREYKYELVHAKLLNKRE